MRNSSRKRRCCSARGLLPVFIVLAIIYNIAVSGPPFVAIVAPDRDAIMTRRTRTTTPLFQQPKPSTPMMMEDASSRTQINESSACLLVMDDNHFLIEWLAYHYHTTMLRNLIVAVDPRSATSPIEILDRWKYRMNITIWNNDTDYIFNSSEIPEAELWVSIKFENDNPPPDLIRHRARQRLFYYHCMQEHKRQKRGLTLLLDTDEFVRINFETARQQQRDTKTALVLYDIPNMWEAGSVLSVIQREQRLQRPQSNITNSLCIQIPRLRFGARIDSSKHLPPGPFNASLFVTLRWHHHAAADNYQHNRISKTIVDLQQVDWSDLQPVESIHRPVVGCSRRKLHIRPAEQLLVIHHYVGTWQQYSFRRDARKGNERSPAMYAKAAAIAEEISSDIVPWLGGFVQTVGLWEAQRLLSHVGEVPSIPTTQ